MKEHRIFLMVIGLSLLLLMGCTKKPTLDIPIVESNMRYLQNDRIKFGIDLRIGGAATLLTDQLNGGQNMINSTDWGRQIQLSYYSGPIPYIGPNGVRPVDSWVGLGWNPIQSGNYGGIGSKVTTFERRGDNAMFVRLIPMHWPFVGYVPGECVFEILYTLEGNAITMEATLINNRPDKTQYAAKRQEMPAVYPNGPWYHMVAYLGDEPFTGKPTKTIINTGDGKGWPWLQLYSPENWVALLDNKGYGIGVFQPEHMYFNVGFFGGDALKGVGGEKDTQAGYIAPRGEQILDHNITYTYKASFILGTEDEIRTFAKNNWAMKAKPEWVFDDTRDNWYYSGSISDTGWPILGGLDINYKASALLIGPRIFWKSADAPYLEIEGAFTTASTQLTLSAIIQPIAGVDFTEWLAYDAPGLTVAQEKAQKGPAYPEKPAITVNQTIIADGVSRKYRIYLGNIPAYTGAMKNLQLKLGSDGKAKIASIKFTQ